MFDNLSRKIPLQANGDIDFSLLATLGKGNEWHKEPEGQLAVDVAHTADEVVIVAAMAGTPAESIELHLHNDLLTIRGERHSPIEGRAEHFYQECYWGTFSRSIVLPVDVKAELVQAVYKNGVLVVRFPKAHGSGEIPILVIED